jgi:two-component system, cell cycle response regulator CtrA
MRILHIDSSNERHLDMVLTCRHHEIVVHFAESGDEAISILARDTYDVIIVAPSLEDFDGAELVRRLRVCRIRSPIVLLGSDTTPQFRARALWDGADDVMNLPWDREEMLARVKSLARRAHGHVASIIRVGPLIIDQERMRITVTEVGAPIPMTEKEYLILELLAMRVNRVCTKPEIMNHLYGGLDEPEEKIVDVFVCKARRKLGQHGQLITTVWGRGYMLRSETSTPPAVA